MALRKIGEPIRSLYGEHLDDLTTTGVWHQSASSRASASLGYPTGIAGLLEVHSPAGSMVYQRYTVYNSGDIYHRGRYNDVWADWKRLLTS